jgi:hypothetical protein
MMSEDFCNRNPTGKGPLGNHPEHRWRALFACGKVVSCSALSKRTGKRCCAPPVKGYGVCRNHGGWGGTGRFRPPTNMRHLGNKDLKRVRLAAEAEVKRRFATGERISELREAARAIRPWIGKIHPADEARAVLMMEVHLEGLGRPDGLNGEAWRETLRALGVMPQRPLPPTPAPEP